LFIALFLYGIGVASSGSGMAVGVTVGVGAGSACSVFVVAIAGSVDWAVRVLASVPKATISPITLTSTATKPMRVDIEKGFILYLRA
jgi:hypothetical protein